MESTKAGEAATSAITDVSATATSAPETVANASDVSKSVVATTADVADIPLSVSKETVHVSEQKSGEPSSSVSDIVSAAGNEVPIKIGVVASSSGQAGSTTKLVEAVSSAGAIVKPTRQDEAVQVAHTSGSRVAAQSRPEIRILTATKANSSDDDVSDAFRKSIQERQKLAALQGTLGSHGKDGAGALFLLGQPSGTAGLVSILYGQH